MFNIFLNDFPTEQLNVANLISALSDGTGVDGAVATLNDSIINQFIKLTDVKKEKNIFSVYSALRSGLKVSEEEAKTIIRKLYSGYNCTNILAVCEDFVSVVHETFNNDTNDISGFIQSKMNLFTSTENLIIKYITGRRFLNILLRMGNNSLIGSYLKYIKEISKFIKGLDSVITEAGEDLIKWC